MVLTSQIRDSVRVAMVLTSRIRDRVRVNCTYISDTYDRVRVKYGTSYISDTRPCQGQWYLNLRHVTVSESMVLISRILDRVRVNGTNYISDT